MDALEFLKAYNRMCDNYGGTCTGCPLEKECCNLVNEDCNFEKVVSVVEKWAKEHPVKTRQSKFLEQFPDAELDEDGVINISPCLVNRGYGIDCIDTQASCSACRRTYWMEEIE